MTTLRRIVALVLLLTVAIPISGCFEQELATRNVLGVFMVIFGGQAVEAKRPRPVKFRDGIDTDLSGWIGGLDGTFDIDVGSYGNLSGTAQIKGQKAAKMKATDDEGVKSVVEGALLDATGVEISVDSSKTSFKGSQTTGGVTKNYRVKVTFRGTVVSGEHAGRKVRGKLLTKGSFE